ncbi:hypothetical protein Micbo1qcDRAFT_180766 [Microdochium bolleyi]|uniref:Apple domain-containing protein n=1 Tax=Microdochium bolleyi TaxID=196109 RepID=A0A136IL06_9PEZI|nr:hypothetical protein Micbo1qcDRAFT_180766 [Microdochium bolleyi]
MLHKLVGVLLLGAVPVFGCGLDDRQYIRHPDYDDAGQACPITSGLPGYIGSSNFNNQGDAEVKTSCQSACNSYRDNNSINCNAYILQLVTGQPTMSGTLPLFNSWQCGFYTSLPAAPYDYSCDNSGTPPSSMVGIYRETVNSCFASTSSTEAASDYCSDYIGAQPGPVTVYSVTSTETPDVVTEIITDMSTITVTQTASAAETEYTDITETSVITESVTTITVKITTAVVVTSTAKDITKTSTTVKVVTPTTTLTKTVCKVNGRGLGGANANEITIEARRTIAPGNGPGFVKHVGPGPMTARHMPGDALFGRAAAPACLMQGGQSIPPSIISSACSCLFPATVSGMGELTITESASTTQETLAYTVTESDFTVATSFRTITILESAQELTTRTVVSTRLSTISIRATSVFTRTALRTDTKTTTTATKTVTKEVQQSSIPTFALYARPAGAKPGSTKWRVLTRKIGGVSNADPESRVIQYSRSAKTPPGSDGVTAAIVDGKLYVFSQTNTLKLYGLSIKLGTGPNKGRFVLGQQDDKTDTLTGCSVDKSTGVLSCKVTGGKPVQWQELGWPGAAAGDTRLMLGQIPAGGGKKYTPVMELVAADFGSVQVGCK